MASKRKADTSREETSARETKKMKVMVARTIAVQPVNTNSAIGSPVVGLQASNSMERLPGAIDVEKFTEARAFEIDAMQNAIKSVSANSTQRAWQALPRHLRRRAASHDVRRVPLRLREKARAEMDPVRKKISGQSSPKHGKGKSLSRTMSFLKRQHDKLWLETHIWHAKRMKMENMWGYRLALHPTEKAYRPSHRASVHGSIIHDASYYSLIEVKGPERVLKLVLDACCDPQSFSPGSTRYSGGSRSFDTHIYEPGSYPFGLIGPITVIWQPFPTILPTAHDLGDVTSEGDESSTERKREGKKESKENVVEITPDTTRVVWLRSHPSIHNDIFSSLQTTVALVLEAEKHTTTTPGVDIQVEIADLRGQVGAFEIMGPKSCQVLKGALTPIPHDQREDFKKFWSSLTHLQTSGSAPRGMIIGFKVIDPRLRFPPKNAKLEPPKSDHVPGATRAFPSSSLAETEIWNASVRNKLVKPRYKKKDLDERRAKASILIPGTPLKATRQDNRVPVMLIQRSIDSPGSDSQAIHGWTLIIPAGWSMAFFSSLTFTGTRVGGQRERQTQSFEAGTCYFPRDYPSSIGYNVYATKREQEDRERWERKPPSKRTNFEKLGTRSPWKADWEVLLGLRKPQGEEGDDFIPTQRETETNLNGITVKAWLLRGVEAPKIISNISNLTNHGAGLLQELNRFRLKRGQGTMGIDHKPEELLKAGLVSIKIKVIKRGAPEDLALIYSVEDDEAKKWERVMGQHISSAAMFIGDETPEEIKLSEIKPSESSIIGYVTTGHFSLSQGGGFAIGAIPLTRYLQLQEQSRRYVEGMSYIADSTDVCQIDYTPTSLF
ncbi:ribonucleases P/MRP protein subunit POP1-domain-containing protein [Collybia nuda]|uniref:Ribonucleases P/MRP protein subunit POP1-domain-containing protein n=1 Tax=Collybia nuda TaxID=64659 RepID=A0A9P5YH72_9AGAR|nr:ribonucleases P/MRP protein subunit POP1-domain-containing protein [Collybia nuda]